MFDDLEHYLSTLIARERIDTILNILNSLTNLVGPDPIVAFSQYSLGVPVEVDPNDEIARFDDAIENLIISSLGELGIVLDEDQLDSGKLPTIANMVAALETVAMWQDADRLLAIMSDSDNHEMALAEVIAELSDDDATDYVLLLESVSNDFYNNLMDMIQSNADADQAQIAETTGGPLPRIKTHFQNKPDSFVSGLIRENVLTFGLDYGFYLKFYENHLWEFEPEVLVTELVNFAMCSNTQDGDIGSVALNAIGNYAEGIEQAQSYRRQMEAAVANLPDHFNQPTVREKA